MSLTKSMLYLYSLLNMFELEIQHSSGSRYYFYYKTMEACDKKGEQTLEKNKGVCGYVVWKLDKEEWKIKTKTQNN